MTRSESTAVEARFTAEGEIIPQSFEWQGAHLVVEGIGRRWKEEGRRCFNVMAMGGRLFELQLDEETLRWSVAHGPVPRMAI